MKSYSSREIIQILNEDGWYLVRVKGDHHQFKHPTKIGLVTVTHPVKDVLAGTVKKNFSGRGAKNQLALNPSII